MKSIQWLLLGGPGHGKTVWIKAGGAVLYPGPRGKMPTRYQGENYLYNGRLYRVGRCDEKISEALIDGLIQDTKLNHIAGD